MYLPWSLYPHVALDFPACGLPWLLNMEWMNTWKIVDMVWVCRNPGTLDEVLP